MKIGRQFERRREKFERKMRPFDKLKSVPEKFFENLQERDLSKRGAPRENSWRIVRSVCPVDSKGADREGVYRARVGVNVAANQKHEDE